MTKYIGKRVLKTGLAVTLALIISMLLNIPSTFAAVVALIGLKESTHKTVRYGITLIYGSIIALILGLIILALFGSNPVSFGIGTILIIPLLVWLKLNDGLILSVVVLYHVIDSYALSLEKFFVFSLQEFSLLIIGVSVSVIVNLIFPQHYSDYIEKNLSYFNKYLSNQLNFLADKIANPTCVASSFSSLTKQRNNIRALIKHAELSKENSLLPQKKEYYDSLISQLEKQKRLTFIYEDMLKEANRLCETYQHSHTIAKALRILARIQRYPEHTTPSSYKRLSLSLTNLHDEFEKSKLPSNRKEFEDRASLYHIYLDILDYADQLFLLDFKA